MIPKAAFIAAALGIVAFALWHPVPAPMSQSAAPAAARSASPVDHDGAPRFVPNARASENVDIVVYVAGAVKKPGLYHVREGDRAARAVALAGGLTAAADAGAVNLAQRVADGDEIFAAGVGSAPSSHTAGHRRSGRHRHRRPSTPPSGSIDVNRSGADELAAVPGIGHALGQRIVELREREGRFTSLDELLDVAGMTPTRLERARPYLQAL